ncbi:hypothetical protein HGB25_00260 [Candidatus Saccharibacteria bacterium]|nr:hypothetical protein [Candidatus Saccharibacteria bacterium]
MTQTRTYSAVVEMLSTGVTASSPFIGLNLMTKVTEPTIMSYSSYDATHVFTIWGQRTDAAQTWAIVYRDGSGAASYWNGSTWGAYADCYSQLVALGTNYSLKFETNSTQIRALIDLYAYDDELYEWYWLNVVTTGWVNISSLRSTSNLWLCGGDIVNDAWYGNAYIDEVVVS